MKKILLVTLMLVLSLGLQAQTIHFMLFAATNDAELGAAAENVKKYFTYTFIPSLRNNSGMSVSANYYCGNDFTKSKLESVVSNLYCGSNDVIIFYFYGHGFNDCRSSCPNPNDYPTITLGTNEGPINPRMKSELDIFNSLKKKPHRLLITIAECCNRCMGGSCSSIPQVTPNYVVDISAQKIKQLFSATGDYIVSSSSKGEYSFSGNMGFFTSGFKNAFEEEVSSSNRNYPSWSSVFNNAASKTTATASRHEVDGTKCVQHPQWKKNGNETTVKYKVMNPSAERKLSKMFEKPKEIGDGIRIKGKYFNMSTTNPQGLVLAKYPDGKFDGRYMFGHLGNDNFYPQILTMFVNNKDEFYIMDMNKFPYGRQYDSYGNMTSDFTDSGKDYKISYIEYSDGAIYLGETVGGQKDGFGIYIWSNGDSWYGKWSGDVRLGYGIFCYYDGTKQVQIGYWNNNTYSAQ